MREVRGLGRSLPRDSVGSVNRVLLRGCARFAMVAMNCQTRWHGFHLKMPFLARGIKMWSKRSHGACWELLWAELTNQAWLFSSRSRVNSVK